MKNIIILLMTLLASSTLAGNSHQVVFKGQGFETFNLDSTRTVTRYRTETRDSTCTREVPYQKEVCGYETRYERECRWEPGRQHCYTDYRQECRTVTRYRQQCSQGPGRRVCRQTPGRRQCRTLPNGQQRCRHIPGRQICEQKPGRRQCRQVPYQTRECQRVPYRRCEQIPGRQVCENVPKQVWECRMETRYRTEEYACQKEVQVPYDVKQDVEATVDVNFENKSDLTRALNIVYNLNQGGNIIDKLHTEDYLVMRSMDVDRHDGDVFRIKSNFTYTLYNKKAALAPAAQKIKVTHLTPWYLSFVVGKSTLPQAETELILFLEKIGGNQGMGAKLDESNTTMTEQTYGYFVTVNLKELGVDLKPSDFIDLTLTAEMKGVDAVNVTKEELERTDSFSSLEVK